MTRDYKPRGSRRRRSRTNEAAPGWMWLLAGLTLGLSVAASIYLYDRRPQHAASPATVPAAPAAMPEVRKAPEREAPEPAEKSRYSFYEMLPKFEVVIPETEADVRPDSRPVSVTDPGAYVLQAGSFSSFADADRMKARLALLGIESRIQKVSIDNRTFHRSRIGPVSDLDELNRLRRRLREAEIEVLVIRVAE